MEKQKWEHDPKVFVVFLIVSSLLIFISAAIIGWTAWNDLANLLRFTN